MAIVCDLDGVIWLATEPIPGSADAVARLRAGGERVLFVTNNSASRLAEVEAKLGSMGIPAVGDVVTSSRAAASLVAEGERVAAFGGPGVFEALTGRGARIVDDADAVTFVLGRSETFDFAALSRASTVIRRGARFIATNDDTTFPTPHGLEPGNGALVAAVATAAGVVPLVAGKPYAPMAGVVRELVGAEDVIMVGDRPDTDGRFATTLGGRFGLVLSGVTREADLPVAPTPAFVAADLAGLVEPLLARSPGPVTPAG